MSDEICPKCKFHIYDGIHTPFNPKCEDAIIAEKILKDLNRILAPYSTVIDVSPR